MLLCPQEISVIADLQVKDRVLTEVCKSLAVLLAVKSGLDPLLFDIPMRNTS